MADRAYLEALTRRLVDEGLLIEAGWVGLRIACKLEDAPRIQLEEMRNAFFAGAQHVFHSITGGLLDPGSEPTDADLRRMDQIDAELRRFIVEYSARNLPTSGSA
ncbi:hypothetical protein CQ14_06590 [Bradyrhizobium lablabi]|uniref:Uncharacterized protein n=1 Tax=Bradyrhizobium lablabi TaxID=722472 RepID=A0A0R3MT10_9BRAD|nr:hypothetical protein [Bradyrhizobium lablabi]KRR21311.1 hypothetical protein CQ14_06590 [Bradyrhizobium lablabi]